MYSLILDECCLGSHEINMLLRSDVYIIVMIEPTSERSVCAGYTYYLPNRTEHSKIQLKRNKHTVNILIYIYIFDKNFNNRYFITLEITFIHTVDIEDNII